MICRLCIVNSEVSVDFNLKNANEIVSFVSRPLNPPQGDFMKLESYKSPCGGFRGRGLMRLQMGSLIK